MRCALHGARGCTLRCNKKGFGESQAFGNLGLFAVLTKFHGGCARVAEGS